MPYEIINSAQVTPARLHALVRLVGQSRATPRKLVQELLQPSALSDNKSAVNNLISAAVNCGLVDEADDSERSLVLRGARAAIEEPRAFRAHMQRALLGVSDPSRPNYLLNLFSAWYAAQDDRSLRLDGKALEVAFGEDLFPGQTGERPFNETKLGPWKVWAAFLGLGWQLPGRGSRLVPDARDRLLPLLPALLPEPAKDEPVALFMARLREHCPELDGGALFARCRPSHDVTHGNRLSLMVSSGLRTLQGEGHIALLRDADARDVWPLFPAAGHETQEVTHIRRGGQR